MKNISGSRNKKIGLLGISFVVILLSFVVILLFLPLLVKAGTTCGKVINETEITGPYKTSIEMENGSCFYYQIYPLRFIPGICTDKDGSTHADTCGEDYHSVKEVVWDTTSGKCVYKDEYKLPCNYRTIKGICEKVEFKGEQVGRCCSLMDSYCNESQGIHCCSGLNCVHNKCTAENPDGVTFTSIPSPVVINGLEGKANITIVIGNNIAQEGAAGKFYCKESDSSNPVDFTVKKEAPGYYYAVFMNGATETIMHECTYQSSDIPLDKNEVTASVTINGETYTGTIPVTRNTGFEFTVPQTVQLGVPFDAVIKKVNESVNYPALAFAFSVQKEGFTINPEVNILPDSNGANTLTFTISGEPAENVQLSASNTTYNLQILSNEFDLKSCLKNGTTTCSSKEDCCLFYEEAGSDGFNYCYFRPICNERTCVFETYNMSMLDPGYTCRANGPCNANSKEDCHNGIDDDCNGFVDCQDPACKLAETSKEPPKWWPSTASRSNGELTDLQDFFTGTSDCRRSFNSGMPGCSLVECGLCVNGKRCDCNMLGYQSGDQFNWWNSVISKSCTLVDDDYCKSLDENSECTNAGGLCINRSVLKGGECTAEQGLKDLVGITCKVNGNPNCGMACCAPERTEGTTSCGNEGEPCCPYGCNEGLSCCMATTNVLLPQNYYEPTHGYSCQKSCSALTSPIQSITPNEDGSITVYLTLRNGKKARLTLNNGTIVQAELDGDIWGNSAEYKKVGLDNTKYQVTDFGSDVYLLLGDYLRNISVSLPVQVFPELGCAGYNKDTCTQNGKYCEWNSTTSQCQPKIIPNPDGRRGYGEKCSQLANADPKDRCNSWLGLICVRNICQCKGDARYQEVGEGFSSCVPDTQPDKCSLNHPVGILAFENRVFVADTFNSRIVDLAMKNLSKIDEIHCHDYSKDSEGRVGGCDNPLTSPLGLAITESKLCTTTAPYLYILDAGSKMGKIAYVWLIRKSDRESVSNLRFANLYFLDGLKDIGLPAGIATVGDYAHGYDVFISDLNAKKVYVFIDKDNILRYVSDLSGFEKPTGIVVMNEKVYVVDTGSVSIKVFKKDQNGYSPDKTIDLKKRNAEMPVGITALDGYLYVTDASVGNGKIYKINPEDDTLEEVKIDGRPVGISASSSNGMLYVADYARNRILEYNSDLELKRSVSNICEGIQNA